MPAVTKGRRRLMGEINVVPYIDVMLVLLIIFMVTAPMLTQGVKVDLPKASAEPLDAQTVKDQELLVLTVDHEGRLMLNVGDAPTRPIDEATLVARATAALRRAPERPVLIKADKSISYGRVMEAMVLLQGAGAERIGLVADPLPPARPDSRNR